MDVEKKRTSKIIALIAIIIALLGLSFSFAAFSTNLNINKQAKQAQEFHKQEERKAFAEQAKILKGKKVVLKVKVGENGKLFGAVTSQEIVNELTKIGIDIEKKKLDTPVIKMIGSYQIKARFCEGISADFMVQVEPE